ncbi:hypothetical protein PDJAM_G00087280 [Pangasius djambal]|uniref:Uncharacterized protein n=1 Tax=Pangasius djambal TaxID=1691987 RepID=A0ACC5Z4S2_9TELE|nr:hypothetical protein [Pangasius djambal]
MAKLSRVLENDSHPLHKTLVALGSSFSDRRLHPKCVKERYRRSFLPAAVSVGIPAPLWLWMTRRSGLIPHTAARRMQHWMFICDV